MKISFLTSALLVAFLYSCNNKDEASKTDIYLAQKRADYNIQFYYRGEESLSDFKEIIGDKSNPEVGQKIKKLYSFVKRLEVKSASSLKIIHDLQSHLLKFPGFKIENVNSDNIRPLEFNLSQVPASAKGEGITKTNIDQIIESLISLRKDYTEILTSSATYDVETYFFRDPNILHYKSKKDLHTQIITAIKSGNVGPDDQYILEKIYTDLTEMIVFLEDNTETTNWLQSCELLTTIESAIYNSRANVIQTMRYRFTGCGYSFNKILSTATGPSIVKKGEKITLQVCMAAYNSYKQPIVRSPDGTLIGTKEGKGFIEVKGDKPGYKKVKGTITILNKSGIPKTLPWEKEILVTE